jgi:hypothetical protein
MSFDFINPWMLAGLAGVSLPLLAHLISRRKFDVVDWGAMQFLELGRKTRQRVRLEEFLLMLLRMALIGLIAFALSRPWASGGLFSGLVSTQSRDVVLVIDGSYSMGREDGATTPHTLAIQQAQEFLQVLNPGDTVSLVDARDQLRSVIAPPTRDLALVREELDNLPEPSGSATPSEACAVAVQMLGRTSNLAREAVVFTDGQALGWSPYDDGLWNRFELLREQPTVNPNVWVIDVTEDASSNESNYFVDQLELSRELTVTDFPIRITTKIGRTGGTRSRTRRVHLEIDGQRLREHTQSHSLQPDGEVTVEFEYRFSNSGSHLISVALEDDVLPGDNRSDAAITVAQALPVLLVDGDMQPDPIKRETFFAKAALSANENNTPWVNATVVTADKLTSQLLAGQDAVVLANVPRVNDAQAAVLTEFVNSGGGVLFALGDRVEAVNYNQMLFSDGTGILPASLQLIREDESDRNDINNDGIRFEDSSLQMPWIEKFRLRNDGGLTEARFSNWWQVFPAAETKQENRASTDDDVPRPQDSSASVTARLTTGDPALITRRYGRGSTMLMTVPIDADWSSLPARPDFVPFLHELLFVLASGQSQHNVDVGVPLLHPVKPDFVFRDFHFVGPDDTTFEVERAGDELRPVAKLADTKLPGVYRLSQKNETQSRNPIWFVVNFNRQESDLTELTEQDKAALGSEGRLAFVEDVADMKREMLGNESRTEIWHLLMLAFLGMLVAELLMTRRLVKGGHAEVDTSGAAGSSPESMSEPSDAREPSLV